MRGSPATTAYASVGSRFLGFYFDSLLINAPVVAVLLAVNRTRGQSVELSDLFALAVFQAMAIGTYLLWFWRGKEQTGAPKLAHSQQIPLTASGALTRNLLFWLPGLRTQLGRLASLSAAFAKGWSDLDSRSAPAQNQEAATNSRRFFKSRPTHTQTILLVMIATAATVLLSVGSAVLITPCLVYCPRHLPSDPWA